MNENNNLGQIFEKIYKKNKDKIAIKMLDKSFSFEDVYKLSNNYIKFLIKKKFKNKIIGIMSDKSLDNYLVMIACIRIGAPYTNLDPMLPVSRNRDILKKLKDVIIFSNKENVKKYITLKKYANFYLFLKKKKVQKVNYNSNFSNQNICYIMFTSGSTGRPKGACITHKNVIPFIKWTKSKFKISKNDNLVNSNPLYFDNSVFDFYASLFNGTTITPINSDQIKDFKNLINYVELKKCTIWFSVPSFFIYLNKVRVLKKDRLKNLKIFAFGGEGFPKRDLIEFFNLYNKTAKFINVYGPTECTCICSSHDVKKNDFKDMVNLLPLGTINKNFSFEISKHNELILIGSGVGNGYINDAKKTSEKFFIKEYEKQIKKNAYRTGDIVKYEKNILFFKGRLDNQIKHMGYRIELEDIENNISSIKNIEKAVVIYEKKELGKIKAFIKLKKKKFLNIKTSIKKKLPNYMMPSEVFEINIIPLNQNGKIDMNFFKKLNTKNLKQIL